MNLSFMMVGRTNNNYIEIASSASPSNSSENSFSSNKDIALEESSPPSSANQCERGPITPRRLILTPLSKGLFDVSSLFAKKQQNIEVVATNEEKPKNNQMTEKQCDQITKHLEEVNNYAKEQIYNQKEAVDDKEMEIFEQKSYFIKQMRDLQERNQMLLRENIMLKEIQHELDKSAEKIAVFRSDQKSLNICSYLYDSWKNRESKADLYQKYTDKSQQYDDLLKKFQELECCYLEEIQNKSYNLGSNKLNTNQTEVIKKKRGRKPKNSNLDNTFTEFENDDYGQKLTKKVLMSLEDEGKNALANRQATNSQNNRNNLQPKQYIVDDSRSEISAVILKEKRDYTNKSTRQNQGNVTPSKGNTTPIRGNVTPIKGNATPIRGNVTPIRGNVTPIKGNVTPMRGNVTPIRGNVTPIKGNATPIKGNATPIKGVTNKNRKNENNSSSSSSNKQKGKEIILLESDKSRKSDISKRSTREQSQMNNNNKTANRAKQNNSKNNNNNEQTNKNSYNEYGNKNNSRMYTQIDDADDDFDDNKSTISNITNITANPSKREIKKKKIISKEQKKYLNEAQDTTFNSIADTLFYF